MGYDDAADLLGNKEMPIIRHQQQSLLSFRSLLYLIISLCLALVVKFAVTDGRVWLRGYRDQAYRRSVRRRYGIPDDSKEPFNVAYARAVQRRADERRKAHEKVSAVPPKALAKEGNDLPRGRGVASLSMLSQQVASGPTQILYLSAPGDQTNRPGTDQSHAFQRDDRPPPAPVSRPGLVTEELSQASTQPRTATVYTARPNAGSMRDIEHATARKRALDKDDVLESNKKNRHEPTEVHDADPEVLALPFAEVESSGAPSQKLKRGAKRQAGPEEEDNTDSARKKVGKKARRSSKRLQEVQPLAEDGDMDQLMDLDIISRGKKRDRAETDSIFGGDDSSPGGQGRKNRRRKRKSSMNMIDETQSRGTKRSHDVESTLDSDEENIPRARASRKRGKRMVPEGDDSTDISFEELAVVRDPTCGDRKIGEEWRVNGQLFKVGPDGRRMRQVLIKKRRSRYSMPQDSHHPDSQSQLIVLVETWLGDEDVKAAEERGDVFSPKKTETEDTGEVEDIPLKTGKQLLWSSPKKAVTVPKKAFKDSIVTNVGLDINPFERPTYSSYTRRVSTGHEAFKPSISGSPALKHSKSYSKWEKQDLEAEAMSKLRKRLEEQKRIASPDPKKVTFQLPTPSPAPSIASSFSAPAGLQGISVQKFDATASKPSAANLFTSSGATSSGTAATPAAVPTSAASPTPPSAMAPPVAKGPSAGSEPFKASTFPFPSSQPSKEQATEAPQKTAFTTSPFNTQPTTPVPNGNQPSPFGTTSNNATTTPAPSSSSGMFGGGAKASDTINSAAGTPTGTSNLFGPKPAITTPQTSGSAVNIFGIKGVAQADHNTQPTSIPGFNTRTTFPSSASSSQDPSKPVGTSAPGGANLFTRFGGTPNGAAASASSNAPSMGSNASPFAFAAPKQSGGNAQPSSGSAQTTGAAATSASSPAAPKFNFGFSTKPPAFTPPPAPLPSTSPSTSSAAPPMFKFNVTPPTQPSSGSPSMTPTTSTGAKLPFGQTDTASVAQSSTPTPAASQSSGNIFGGSGTSANTAAATSGPPKFSFNFGGSGTSGNAPSGFGAAKPTAPTPSPFGATSKSGDVPKPLFGFGSGSTPQPSPTAGSEKQDKSPFSFNFGGASSGPTQSSAPPASITSSNPFGVKPGGSAPTFSFGGAGGSSGTSMGFGAKPAEGGSTFGAPTNNAPANIFGSTFGNQTGSSNG